MFLYGMHMMADGLQKTAGNRIKNLMGQAADHRDDGYFCRRRSDGNASKQFSSNGNDCRICECRYYRTESGSRHYYGSQYRYDSDKLGLCPMQEIGNALNPEFYAPLLIGVGVFLMLFCKTFGKKQIGEILTGTGRLFLQD